MALMKIAAFSDGNSGGNPAGVFISEIHPSEPEMRAMAADIGFSETAFAAPSASGWRVRYFSPASEVPFCGHATIALGAALAKQQGPGTFVLQLNQAEITVEGFCEDGQFSAALQSPSTYSKPADLETVAQALNLFAYKQSDLPANMQPSLANAGANHLIIPLNSRQKLKQMTYNLNAGKVFMEQHNLVTIMLVYPESDQRFHSRNAFASGGVYEDPATGAASAAFAGYLRDINWPHQGAIHIVQGEDMNSRSLIQVNLTNNPGSSIRVSGGVRFMENG